MYFLGLAYALYHKFEEDDDDEEECSGLESEHPEGVKSDESYASGGKKESLSDRGMDGLDVHLPSIVELLEEVESKCEEGASCEEARRSHDR